jgi:hypothetical protein
MTKKNLFIPVIITLITLNSCSTTKNRLIIFDEQLVTEVKVNSACRNSSVLPLKNEDELKEAIRTGSAQSVKELKLSISREIEKSTHKIYKIDFIIYEICAAGKENAVHSFRLEEELVLKNIHTGDLLSFKSDTLINNQALSVNRQLAPRQIKFTDYIPVLTNKNYLKAKLFIKQNKTNGKFAH